MREGIVDLGVDREGEVGGQGPRGGGPDEERSVAPALAGRRAGAPAGGGEGKANVHRRVLDLLVAEGDFVRGKGRPDAGVVGHHLVPAVEQSLVPDEPEEVPDRLDVGVVERVVGVAHVDPETHPLRHPLPVADIAHDRIAASPGELLDADLRLDSGLVEDPELLLDLVLDGKAMGVPSGAARAVVPAHGLVAREHVLEGAREDVVDPGLPVGGRRPFVPDVERPSLGVPLTGLEHTMGAPPVEDLPLDPDAVVAAVDFLKRHGELSA